MKRLIYFVCIAMGLSMLTMTHSSCNKKEVFDKDNYNTIVKILSPVDSVDATQTWKLTTPTKFIVMVNANVGTKRIQFLTDDPKSSPLASVIAQQDANEGDQLTVAVSYPSICTKIYAAAIDAAGAYTVASFNPTNTNFIDFSNPIYKQQTISNTPEPQYYAFCYEQEFPEPGDYDYNDVVMHIALERASAKEMKIHVRLAAVGADMPLSGAIRFPEFYYEDVDTVWTENGESFNKDIKEQYIIVQKNMDQLIKGLKGEAVLNVFNDAHWATGDDLGADFIITKRKQYNVTKTSSSTTQLMVPRTVTFVIKMKKDDALDNLTLNSIDPFIIRQYSGSNLEIHTYAYRHVKALYDYTYTDVTNLPWALLVPSGTFMHPLHGINMGFRMRENAKTGILFGAYATYGHAFGEWAMDKSKATDWYNYPDRSNVFVW